MQKYCFLIKKNPLKETKSLQDIITNLKFQQKPKYHLSKNPSYKNTPTTQGPISQKDLKPPRYYDIFFVASHVQAHGRSYNPCKTPVDQSKGPYKIHKRHIFQENGKSRSVPLPWVKKCLHFRAFPDFGQRHIGRIKGLNVDPSPTLGSCLKQALHLLPKRPVRL